MNKKGEFTTQKMLLSILVVGLFMGVFGAIITINSFYYDTSGYDEDEMNSYNNVQNLSQVIQDQYEVIDDVQADSSWFDFLSGMWSKLLAPFQFIYRTFSYMITIFKQATSLFQLLPIFKEFFVASIMTLVVIGIVLIKFGLGRNK